MTTAIDKNDVIILGFPVAALASLELKQGFNAITFKTLILALEPHVVEMRRGDMEKNFDYRHFIPYILLGKIADGVQRAFGYQRGKGIGESRLLGKSSIGLGGHVDAADAVRYPDGRIDLYATLFEGARRELAEEVTGECGALVFRGVIVDDSDEVGRVHLGVVLEATANHDGVYECKEPELSTHGFLTNDELAELDLESWSKILHEQLLTAPRHLQGALVGVAE